jgi:hypothetical protein
MNRENPTSLASIVPELFKMQPTAFYFEMDSISLSITTISVVCEMHIHDIFYYTIVKDSNSSILCVINFEQTHVTL